ncbi:TMEM165/GDT1 family protein [uncultured Sphingomonas sp.]|uniref:TMEM165/GDT1 family protein n=1 Tax=uncultured Sphingomonas sp. TaxID=158754 RepID=UPI0035C9787A
MAALVAGALAQSGDRTPWLAAILTDRYARPGLVILAAALALLCASSLACTGALLLEGRLTPEAGRLFLALALLLQGAGGLMRSEGPDRLAGWKLGAFGTSYVGLFILAFGDGLQFIVLAVAARAALPWAAAIGATIGSLAVIAPAALIGERAWTALPQLAARRVAAVLFLATGAALALSALRLL